MPLIEIGSPSRPAHLANHFIDIDVLEKSYEISERIALGYASGDERSIFLDEVELRAGPNRKTVP
jgi:hypothetical protein